MNTAAILEARFPGVLVIKPVLAGSLLNQSHQSTYNQVSAGRFPVKLIVDHLGRKMVRLSDLAEYIDSLSTVEPQPTEPCNIATPKGRPTKVEQMEAQRRGITVQELRAQTNIEGV